MVSEEALVFMSYSSALIAARPSPMTDISACTNGAGNERQNALPLLS